MSNSFYSPKYLIPNYVKSKIIDFINALMEASPEVVEEKMTESVKEFLSYLETKSEDNYELTDNGKQYLNKFFPIYIKTIFENPGMQKKRSKSMTL